MLDTILFVELFQLFAAFHVSYRLSGTTMYFVSGVMLKAFVLLNVGTAVHPEKSKILQLTALLNAPAAMLVRPDGNEMDCRDWQLLSVLIPMLVTPDGSEMDCREWQL